MLTMAPSRRGMQHIRCGFGVLLALCSILPASMASAAQVSNVINTCSNSEAINSPHFDTLAKDGWQESTGGTPAFHRQLLVEGILAAMSTDRKTQIVWSSARAQAEKLALTLSTASMRDDSVRIFLLDQTQKATLVVMDRSKPGNALIHCIYGGFTDNDIVQTLMTVERMDRTAGLAQASPGLQIMDIRDSGSTGGTPAKQYTIESRFGLYDVANLPKALPAFEAAMGISIVRFTQQ